MKKAAKLLKLRVPEESLILNFLKNIESIKDPFGKIDFKKARSRLAYLYSIKKEKIAEQIIFLQDLGFLKINAGNIELNYEVLNGIR